MSNLTENDEEKFKEFDGVAVELLDEPDDTADVNISSLRSHLPPGLQVVITVFYAVGILGNSFALHIIGKSETKKYKKQALMLRCLASNDLVALVGSLLQMYITIYFDVGTMKWSCTMRVVLRVFGMGSGFVALVMALERWLALSHPFFYQKHVTPSGILKFILALWALNAALVCAPLLGFGLWYDTSKLRPCVRYRDATKPVDVAYAYLVFSLGMVMCSIIVACNTSVIRVLCHVGSRHREQPRRYSRNSYVLTRPTPQPPLASCLDDPSSTSNAAGFQNCYDQSFEVAARNKTNDFSKVPGQETPYDAESSYKQLYAREENGYNALNYVFSGAHDHSNCHGPHATAYKMSEGYRGYSAPPGVTLKSGPNTYKKGFKGYVDIHGRHITAYSDGTDCTPMRQNARYSSSGGQESVILLESRYSSVSRRSGGSWYTKSSLNGLHMASTVSRNGRYKHATPEEQSFAKLMTVLSILFVLFWMPQFLTILITQQKWLGNNPGIFRVADILIALNFVIDPYVYVIFRRRQRFVRRYLRRLIRCQIFEDCLCCCRRKRRANVGHPAAQSPSCCCCFLTKSADDGNTLVIHYVARQRPTLSRGSGSRSDRGSFSTTRSQGSSFQPVNPGCFCARTAPTNSSSQEHHSSEEPSSLQMAPPERCYCFCATAHESTFTKNMDAAASSHKIYNDPRLAGGICDRPIELDPGPAGGNCDRPIELDLRSAEVTCDLPIELNPPGCANDRNSTAGEVDEQSHSADELASTVCYFESKVNGEVAHLENEKENSSIKDGKLYDNLNINC